MIAIVNGPNLNLLGRREPEIYGTESFDDFLASMRRRFPSEELVYFQSNVEGELVTALQDYGYTSGCRGIVLNPGAYSHYSVAIADAVSALPVPVVEVHISNIHAREEFRHTTLTGAKARGIIAGLGLDGYRLAVEYLLSH